MTTLKDLIEREVEKLDDVTNELGIAVEREWGVDSFQNKDFNRIEPLFRQSLETIAKETANALRREEREYEAMEKETPYFSINENMRRHEGYCYALQDIAKREEEFFNKDNK